VIHPLETANWFRLKCKTHVLQSLPYESGIYQTSIFVRGWPAEMKMVAMLQFDPRSHQRSIPFARNCLTPTAAFIGRILSSFLSSFVTVFLLAFLSCSPARAGVGVILNESLDSSLERITGSGHTAVYFSHICPESPVKLRLCHRGEEGSVMSNYINLGE
jgi:hypothetical protein